MTGHRIEFSGNGILFADRTEKPAIQEGETLLWITDRGKLGIVYGDVTLFGYTEKTFHLIFSYQTGGLESMVKHGKEWLYRTPEPTFWRAATDNDRGNGFPFRTVCG